MHEFSACGFKGTLEARTSSSVVVSHVVGGVAKLLKEETKKSDEYSGITVTVTITITTALDRITTNQISTVAYVVLQ